jgi:AraC-like DNA-binding protein
VWPLRFSVSTDHLPQADRFEFWRDLLAEETFDSPEMTPVAAVPPVQARTQFADSFNATLQVTVSSALGVVVTENESMDVVRTQAMVRRCDSDVFYLAVNYRGVQHLVLDRDVIELRPSDMVLLHSSLPMHSRIDPQLRRQRNAMVPVDAGGLPGGSQGLRQLVGTPLSSQDGMVSLVAHHLHLLGTGNLHPGDAEELSSLTSSLIMLMLARQARTEHQVPSETRAEALFARIRSYILTRLMDPNLNADTVAAVHYISKRTLHRLFQARGVTVAAWIRQLRLERCRAELLDPAFADRPVQLIARRWGFTDASQFSRAYRAMYGESPAASRASVRTL